MEAKNKTFFVKYRYKDEPETIIRVVYISTQPDKKSAIDEVKRIYGYGVGVVITECYECN